MLVHQSSKWKFEFTGPSQILEFIFKNWKFYWSLAGGPVLIVRIGPPTRVNDIVFTMWQVMMQFIQKTTDKIWCTKSCKIESLHIFCLYCCVLKKLCQSCVSLYQQTIKNILMALTNLSVSNNDNDTVKPI